jgi:hypothetical protein
MPFEVLAYLAVRQVRYANMPMTVTGSTPESPTPPERPACRA